MFFRHEPSLISRKEKVFESAAQAFFQIMWKIGKKNEVIPEIIEVKGHDLKELLVNFLEEFLYLYDAKGFICTQLEVESVTDNRIIARCWLQEFSDKTDQEILGVKAVTYHQLHIDKQGHEWKAQVFLDI